jgi:predicted AAA+ superfamily ATPase
LYFSHYRDKDKLEIDIIIENNLDEIIAIEVKGSATLSQKDLNGLKKLKEISKERFKIGLLLYDGDHTTSFGDKLYAAPLATLWS